MSGIQCVPFDLGALKIERMLENLNNGLYRFAVLNSRVGLERALQKSDFHDKLKIYKKPIALKSYYVAFSKHLPAAEAFVKRFDRIHKLYRSTAHYDALLDKYNLDRELFVP